MLILLILIYIAFISLGLPDSLFGVSWPVMHVDLGLDESFASVVSVIIAVGTVCTSIFAGKVIRKFGTGNVTAVSVLLTAVGLFGISLAPNIFVMVAFAVVLGTGAGAIDTALNDFVGKYYKPQHMNWLHAFWGVGVTLSPLIMSSFLTNENWRGGYTAVAVIQTVIGVIMCATLFLWKKADKRELLNTEEKVSTENEAVSNTEEQTDKPWKKRGVIFAVLALFCYCGMEYVISVWGATFLVNTKQAHPSTASLWITLYYCGIMIGRFLCGFLSMRISNDVLIKCGSAVAIVGIAVLCMPFEIAGALCGLLLIGLGFAPVFPCSIHATSKRFGKKYSADIVGYQMAGAYVGSFIFQLTVGAIARVAGFEIMPYSLLILASGLFLFEFLLNRSLKGVKREKQD